MKKQRMPGTNESAVVVRVQELQTVPVQNQEVEMVERKGVGHPDTICDAIGEAISLDLSKAYRKTFGRILHHNIDKGLLVAGRVDCRLGGGRVLEPMRIIIGDRAAMGIGKKRLPVAAIATNAAKAWIKRYLPHVDPNRHVQFDIGLKPTSVELGAIFEQEPMEGVLVANDTSAAVGCAPMTPTEHCVLDLERFLNGVEFKKAFPQTGQDVKVMGIRVKKDLSLTVAMPFLSRMIKTEPGYFNLKARVVKAIHRHMETWPHDWKHIDLTVNALDSRGLGESGMYLTVLGTSAEQGDSGQVGRGNRVSGVISFNRPMSEEAVAGKNPVSHVGKIYNVWALETANALCREFPGIREAHVSLCSTIGQRIDQPAVVSVQVHSEARGSFPGLRRRIQTLVRARLKDIGGFCESLAKGDFPVY